MKEQVCGAGGTGGVDEFTAGLRIAMVVPRMARAGQARRTRKLWAVGVTLIKGGSARTRVTKESLASRGTQGEEGREL